MKLEAGTRKGQSKNTNRSTNCNKYKETRAYIQIKNIKVANRQDIRIQNARNANRQDIQIQNARNANRQDIQIQNARNANRQERGHGGDQAGGGNFLGWIGSSRRPRPA